MLNFSITDPAGNVVQNFYDIRGNKYQSDDPDLGVWMYAHDVLGELTSQTDAKGQTTTLTYDVLGRALTRSEAGLYSTWTYGTSASAHNVGQLIEAKACTDSSCAGVVSDRTIAYDSFGRPASSQLAASTGTFGYTTSYNPSNGKIATVTHPSGFVEQSTYNQYGYLCLITDNAGSPACGNAGGAQVFFTVNTRDAELHLTQSTAGNGVVTNQAFSALTGLIQAQTAGPGNSVASFSYTFDTIGNLTARSDNVESYTENFCYDTNLNRLTNYNTGPLGSSSCMGGKTIAYDGAGLGNIISKSDAGTYAYPASGPESVLPHAVSSITGTVDGLTNPQYSYDGNGNLGCISTEAQCHGTIAKAVQTTSFNMAAVILQGTTSVAIGYDSEHKRLVQTSTVSGETTTTTYVNDPASGAMAENIVTGGVPSWRDYVIVDGAIVAARTSSGGPVWGTAVWGQFTWGAATTSWAYFVLDHLGSVAVITDGSGAVTERLSYDPWGKRRNANGSDAACGTISSPQTRGFTNQEELDQVCFVNLNARIYDPSIGKFLSADPVVGNIYLPNALNRYAYVLNNPLSFTDTTGLEPFTDIVTIEASLETAGTINPVVGAALVVADIVADIFGFNLFGGGPAAVVPHAPPAPAPPSASATQSPTYISGNPTGVPPVTNTLPASYNDVVVITGQAAANSDAFVTQAADFAGAAAAPTAVAAAQGVLQPEQVLIQAPAPNPWGLSAISPPDFALSAAPLGSAQTNPGPGSPNGRGLKVCSPVTARILQGNPSLIGQPGAFGPMYPVRAGSAAVIPNQWGGITSLRQNLSDISGTFKFGNDQTVSFAGVTDVIGGRSPIAGLNVRDALEQMNGNGNTLILELPSATRDFGTLTGSIAVPTSMACPSGTQ